jgi:hypothetical protein
MAAAEAAAVVRISAVVAMAAVAGILRVWPGAAVVHVSAEFAVAAAGRRYRGRRRGQISTHNARLRSAVIRTGPRAARRR